jgi:hypothetical protein
MKRTDTINQQSLFFPDLNSLISLAATSNFVAPNFSVGVVVSPAGGSGPFAGLRSYVAPGVMRTSGSATQNSRCGPCGAASPEFNVTLQANLNQSRSAVISGAIAYAGYQISPSAKVQIETSYERISGAPVFSVPTSPTQQPIALADSSTDVFRIGGKIIIGFAP